MTNPHYEAVKRKMMRQPKTWLVTGCAGFIGSHLIEALLKLNQKVVGLDNFATGKRENLNLVRQAVAERAWKRFHFIKGDIRKLNECYKAFGLKLQYPAPRTQNKKLKPISRRSKVDIVLHQAGLGSVPRSIADPLATHATNVTGTLNMLVAARDARVKRFVYASSSSTYGDSRTLPKKEQKIGLALSPYAVSKHTNELYAKVFGKLFGMETIGLRYFNVFGPRQDPHGAYAAVIPRWIGENLKEKRNVIYGNGRTSRDFCYVDNAVQANLLAGATLKRSAFNEVYNVACEEATSLRKLHSMISEAFQLVGSGHWAVDRKQSSQPPTAYRSLTKIFPPLFLPERAGDVRHSLASIAKARRLLGYRPTNLIREKIRKTVESYVK